MIPSFEHCLVKNVRFFPVKLEAKDASSVDLLRQLSQMKSLLKEKDAFIAQKCSESIANMMTRTPRAKFRFFLAIPTESQGFLICFF